MTIGAVAYGQDVFQAFFRLDTVEHFAHITLIAELFEPGSPLSAEDLVGPGAREAGASHAPAARPLAE